VHVVERGLRPDGVPAKCLDCGRAFKAPPGTGGSGRRPNAGAGAKPAADKAANLEKLLAAERKKVAELQKEAKELKSAPAAVADEPAGDAEEDVVQCIDFLEAVKKRFGDDHARTKEAEADLAEARKRRAGAKPLAIQAHAAEQRLANRQRALGTALEKVEKAKKELEAAEKVVEQTGKEVEELKRETLALQQKLLAEKEGFNPMAAGLQQVKAALPPGWELLPTGTKFIEQISALWTQVETEVKAAQAAASAAAAAAAASAAQSAAAEPPTAQATTGAPQQPRGAAGGTGSEAVDLRAAMEDDEMLGVLAEVAVGPKEDDESAEDFDAKVAKARESIRARKEEMGRKVGSVAKNIAKRREGR